MPAARIFKQKRNPILIKLFLVWDAVQAGTPMAAKREAAPMH